MKFLRLWGKDEVNVEPRALQPINAIAILNYPDRHPLETVVKAYKTICDLIPKVSGEKKEELTTLISEVEQHYTSVNVQEP